MNIKPLATIRQVFTWLCVCSADKIRNKKMKNSYIILTTIILIALLCVISASIAFFMKNVSNDLESSLYCLGQIMPYTSVLYLLIGGLFLRHKIDDLFDQLTEIYNGCE